MTGHDWLYAVGDVNHRALLTHQGKYQARIAGAAIVTRAAGEPVQAEKWGAHTATADRAAVPQVVFTDPEAASVGLTPRRGRTGRAPGAGRGRRPVVGGGREPVRRRLPGPGPHGRRPRGRDRARRHPRRSRRRRTDPRGDRRGGRPRPGQPGCGTPSRRTRRSARCGCGCWRRTATPDPLRPSRASSSSAGRAARGPSGAPGAGVPQLTPPPGNSTVLRPDPCIGTTRRTPLPGRPPPMTTTPTPTTDDAPSPPAPAPAQGRGAWSTLRPLVLRLHFYAGVLVAPFLLVAALTGLLYAASFQAEKIVYDHELTVPVGDRELPSPSRSPPPAPPVPTARSPPYALRPSPAPPPGCCSPASQGWTRATRSPCSSTRTPRRCAASSNSTAPPARCRCAPGSTSFTATCTSANRGGSTASSRRAGCGSSRAADSCCGSRAGARSASSAAPPDAAAPWACTAGWARGSRSASCSCPPRA